MSHYCNICNRIITPREIETGQAIIYGTHCYCPKCKKEVMPIIEAIRQKLEGGKPEKKKRGRETSGVEFIEPVKPRPKRTRAPRPFKLKRRPVQRHHPTEIATTEIFLRRPRPSNKRAEPVEPPIATPVREEKKSEVTEDGLEIEPIDLDSLGKVGEEVPLPPDSTEVGGKRAAPPHSQKESRTCSAQPSEAHIHHKRTPHTRTPTTHPRTTDRTSLPLPQERIVPVHHRSKRHSKALYLILLLVPLGVAGGLVYYYAYYLPRKLEREKALEDSKEDSKKEQEEKRRRKAMKAYQKLLVTVEELIKKKDFNGAEQALEEFLKTHPDTEASAKAETRLSSIRTERRKWTLLTLFDGSSLDNLRIKSEKGFELDKKRLKIEPEEEDVLLFCGYDDMRDLDITLEFVLLKGGFRLLLLSRGDNPSTAFSQEVKYPSVQLNEKMRINIKTRGRDVAITFLHTNTTLPIRKAPNPSGSFGLLVPKGAKLHILKITAKEE